MYSFGKGSFKYQYEIYPCPYYVDRVLMDINRGDLDVITFVIVCRDSRSGSWKIYDGCLNKLCKKNPHYQQRILNDIFDCIVLYRNFNKEQTVFWLAPGYRVPVRLTFLKTGVFRVGIQ